MAFELRVTFSGLCLFLIHDNCKQVGVVLPDCRVGGRLGRFHPDGEPVVNHAGFLRFDLANLFRGAKAKTALELEHPLREGIHHFRNETLTFALRDPGTEMTLKTELPAMERIAPAGAVAKQEPENDCVNDGTSRLVPIKLFGDQAPLAMRTILTGGSVEKKMGSTEWVFPPDALTSGGLPYEGEFATQVTWTRKVEDHDQLDLTIAPFTGSPEQKLTLYPTMIESDGRETKEANQVLLLTIGNLCPRNPLEWGEFPAPPAAREDRDFKWFYQLFRDEHNNPITGLVPYPIRKGGGAGVDTCAGLKTKVSEFR